MLLLQEIQYFEEILQVTCFNLKFQPITTFVEKHEAVRVCTGAPIPPGSDAVVQVEDTLVLVEKEGEEVAVELLKEPVEGQEIRKKGTDIAENTVVLVKGTRLKGASLGILATIGKSTVKVFKCVLFFRLSKETDFKPSEKLRSE